MGAVISQAMRRFVAFASDRRQRLVLLTVVATLLLEPVAAPLIVLGALRYGPAAALLQALIPLVLISIVRTFFGLSIALSLIMLAPVLLGPLAIGTVLARSRSLSLAFQSTVLGAIGLSLVIFQILPGPGQFGETVLAASLEILGPYDLPPERINAIASMSPQYVAHGVLDLMLLAWLVTLMLGYWWFSLITENARFGADFRSLRLGRTAGIVLAVLVVLPAVVDLEFAQYAAQLAVIAFLFQGLAVVHARSHSDQWHPIVIVLVYVALFSFSLLLVVAVAALSVIGLLDNFFALRARTKPQD
jgi:hypothetical protein